MAEQTIFSITITKPCTFKTKRNIGIGSTYKEVMAAYEKEIDKSATDNKTITVGSVYGGIIFHLVKMIKQILFLLERLQNKKKYLKGEPSKSL